MPFSLRSHEAKIYIPGKSEEKSLVFLGGCKIRGKPGCLIGRKFFISFVIFFFC